MTRRDFLFYSTLATIPVLTGCGASKGYEYKGEYKWDKLDLTYRFPKDGDLNRYFTPFTRLDVLNEKQRSEFRNSYKQISEYCALRFTEVSGSENADIDIIRPFGGVEASGQDLGGKTTLYVNPGKPIPYALIAIEINGDERIDRYRAKHECGHSVGLKHNERIGYDLIPKSVMYHSGGLNVKLSTIEFDDFDKNELVERYGRV